MTGEGSIAPGNQEGGATGTHGTVDTPGSQWKDFPVVEKNERN